MNTIAFCSFDAYLILGFPSFLAHCSIHVGDFCLHCICIHYIYTHCIYLHCIYIHYICVHCICVHCILCIVQFMCFIMHFEIIYRLIYVLLLRSFHIHLLLFSHQLLCTYTYHYFLHLLNHITNMVHCQLYVYAS